MKKRNDLIDKFRPEKLKTKGISRNNIYAYPFLEYGHGLVGADQRFIKRSKQSLIDDFGVLQKYKPDFLRNKLRVNTPYEYVRKMTDPEFLKLLYPGEILEIKVDPSRCYVGDLEYITRIMDDMNRGIPEYEAVRRQAEEYWENLITLEDFLRWYRKPELAKDGNSIKDADKYRDEEPLGTGEFYPIKDALDNLPWRIHQPEILIPEDVPQEYIKLVK